MYDLGRNMSMRRVASSSSHTGFPPLSCNCLTVLSQAEIADAVCSFRELKKARPARPCLLVLGVGQLLLSELPLLLLKLPSHPRQSNEAKSEEKQGYGFGHCQLCIKTGGTVPSVLDVRKDGQRIRIRGGRHRPVN